MKTWRILCLFAGYLLSVLFVVSCARGPLKSPEKALRKVLTPQDLQDVESIESLQMAFKNLLAVFDSSSNIPKEFRFHDQVIPREMYRAALVVASGAADDTQRFTEFVREHFDFYEVYGSQDGWGDVLVTGYYAPVLKGSYKKTKQYTRALYKTPPDLVSVDIAAFSAKHPELDWLKAKSTLRGQLVETPTGPMVVPYLERKQIDVMDGVSPLAGKKLELIWLDPVDAFYLQIQGSGIVEIGNQRLLFGYDKQNGYTWFPIGKALTHVIPLEQMSMQRVRAYLATLTPPQRQEILNRDPSYVFFKELKGSPVGFSGAQVVGQRAIATDSSLFAKGVLAFLSVETPVFASEAQLDPSSWELKPRFVFDMDTGGAIKGPGRVDLYMGEGPQMGHIAGAMKRHGKLYYLFPKPEFLQALSVRSE